MKAVTLIVAAFALLLLAAPQCDAASKLKAAGRLRAALTARDQTHARDARTDCYSIKVGSNTKVCSGDNLRDAVLSVSRTALQGVGKLKAEDFPGELKKCSNAPEAVNNAKQPGKDGAAYFGSITNQNGFRKHAAAKCGGLNAANGDNPAATYRYFSLGKFLYFRACPGGDGNGYVYLWGTNDNTAIECKGHDYPSMYAAAKELDTSSPRNSPLKGSSSVDGFKQIATAGTNPNPYMGMASAAALIAEAARDYNVAALNYFFPDLTADAELFLGGRCPHLADTCQNTGVAKNGLHPMAFGGAQGSFCTGTWPQAQGANADNGKLFEAELVVDWFKKKHKATKASNCDGADNAANCLNHVKDLIKTAAGMS